jgi:uncharacterized protein (DUF1697 family)
MAAGKRRYVAFLRGVSPLNCKMAELARALQLAGFEDVKTVRSSGNAVFTARAQTEAALARRAEAAMKEHLGVVFLTHVRSVTSLQELLAAEPFRAFRLPPGAKRLITFLSETPTPLPRLPSAGSSARILCVRGDTALSMYVPGPDAPAFLRGVEKTFGKNVTTRTWETVTLCAK